ncbi:hypothetical protein ACIBQ0_30270 [Nocardia nova]|uniref:hypothetical protein n=1 Tax=Nocardia nova TaxID=37330 RepID=UPI00379EFB9E
MVAVSAGEVDSESPGGGVSGVAQSHQWQSGAVGEFAGDVGERAVVSDVDGGQLRPAFGCAGGQSLSQ